MLVSREMRQSLKIFAQIHTQKYTQTYTKRNQASSYTKTIESQNGQPNFFDLYSFSIWQVGFYGLDEKADLKYLVHTWYLALNRLHHLFKELKPTLSLSAEPMCPTSTYPGTQDSFKSASLNRPSTYKFLETKKEVKAKTKRHNFFLPPKNGVKQWILAHGHQEQTDF